LPPFDGTRDEVLANIRRRSHRAQAHRRDFLNYDITKFGNGTVDINCRGGMHVPARVAVYLGAEQAGNDRLVVAKIGGKTGKAVAQRMLRDVGW